MKPFLLWSLVGLGLWAVLLLGAVAVATPRGEPHQSVTPAERVATRARYRVTSAGVLRGAPHDARVTPLWAAEAAASMPSCAACGAPLPRAGVGPKQPILAAGTISGLSTWYSWHPNEAAAGPALRRSLGPGWRGATVRVCSLHRCVTVRLSDWCLCPGGRIVDLDRRSFVQLAPLSRGVIPVTVMPRLGGYGVPRVTAPEPTAPATDSGG